MTTYFRVTNFDELQHYKDRTPPWIKLYNKLLDDYEFGALPDASKAHFLAICLLASRYENRIPHDPAWIARRINATEDVDIGRLEDAGLIQSDQPRSNVLAERKQNACPERETERETERENILSTAPLVDASPSKPSRKRKKGAREYDEEFLAWYARYPRPEAKGDAFDAYWSMRDGGHSAATLLAGADHAAKKYLDTEKRFIPLPATFLRREEFLDAEGIANGPGPPEHLTPEERMDWWENHMKGHEHAKH